ncbi:MAG: hypothetical protein LUO85_03235 [Methanomassiliicoccales archaeon]|nr:hypothetical protein [Methanomassiliicoccales archaeon]
MTVATVADHKVLKMGETNGGPYPSPGKLDPVRPMSVRAPLVLDLATIDSTEKFGGYPGGGGIGAAIDIHIFLKIVPATEWEVDVEPHAPVEHVCRALCNILEYRGAFKISSPEHASVPFDAAPETIAAAAAGVNAALGRPIGQRELRRIISWNMVDENDGRLELRPDTGVRVAGALFGGVVIVTDELEIACRTPIPEASPLILIVPNLEANSLDLQKMVTIDEKDREKKALEVLMKLMPAAIKSDVAKMGDSIYRLQLLGSKVVEIRRFKGGKELYRLMSMLRVKGCDIIGVHGETGIIAAYVNQQRLDDALALIDEAGMERIITHPDNKGMKITLSK